MEFFETPAGAMTFWKDGSGQVRIVAGTADCIRVFLRGREDPTNWCVLGSPDQRQEIFLAASKSIPSTTLETLSLGGIRLLPDHARWEEIGRDGLDLFTDDSGDVELSLPEH